MSRIPLPRQLAPTIKSAKMAASHRRIRNDGDPYRRTSARRPPQSDPRQPARRTCRCVPLDGAAKSARGRRQPFFPGCQRRRQPVPDQSQPDAFFPDPIFRPGAARRQRSSHNGAPRRAGPDGLGPAWSPAPALPACALRHACAFDPRHGTGLSRRSDIAADRPEHRAVLQPRRRRFLLWRTGAGRGGGTSMRDCSPIRQRRCW